LFSLILSLHCYTWPRQKADAAKEQFKDLDRQIIEEGATSEKIRRITTRKTTSFQRWVVKSEEVIQYEEEHNIPVRWIPTMQEYQDGLVVIRERKYRRAIDDLERLVVQRLFEMKKLGMNGVGTLIRHTILYNSLTLSQDTSCERRLRNLLRPEQMLFSQR
jgi:hypothetical protein